MDLLHDVLALPGTLGRGLAGGRPRSDSSLTDVSASTVSQPHDLLSPLRKLLRPARDACYDDAISLHTDIPETPLNHAVERPENVKYRIQVLRLKLSQAESYTDWLAAATELDALEGHDEWKLEDESAEYDVEHVRARLREMDDTRISRNQKKIALLIRTGLSRNLGGMGNLHLYKHSRIGTKALIEKYNDSVLDTIDALVQLTKDGQGPIEPQAVLHDLLLTRQSFGRTALMLSGGGTFGMNHIGVIKCLFEANLLPRIISGASAGSIVSAVMCTKMDDEIPAVLEEFCYGDLAVFEKPGQETSLLSKAFRFMTKGSLFDIAHLIGVMRELLGDMTFQEAYNRTRRILNICVSAASLYELPRLLNYITSPNVLIWSAVAASCSVPFIFDPGQLLAKDPHTGEAVPWNQSPNRWIDGSVENDIPMTRLAEMFNVNHFIVSQVNPHVVPFLEKDEQDITREALQSDASHAAGPGWAHAMTTFARDEAMQRLQVLQEFGFFPNLMSKVRAVVSQRYAGDITIFPKISYANFPYVLSNPTTDFMMAATLSGEQATWPKLSEIRHRCAIELAIDDAVHQLIHCVAFGPVQLDTHTLHALGYPITQSAQKAREQTRRPSYRTLRTSLDIPRLSLRGPSAEQTKQSVKVSFGDAAVKKKYAPKKVAGPDLHDFSNSEPESDEDPNGNWNLSAEETSDDDSTGRSPPSPIGLWPSTRQLFPWSSQPATPSVSAAARLSITQASKTDGSLTMSAPQTAAPSSPELQYKRLYHAGGVRNVEPGPVGFGLRRRSRSVLDLDVSGTRGMMRRRKLSMGPSNRRRVADDDYDDDDDDDDVEEDE